VSRKRALGRATVVQIPRPQVQQRHRQRKVSRHLLQHEQEALRRDGRRALEEARLAAEPRQALGADIRCVVTDHDRKERESRALDLLLTAGVTRTALIASKVVAVVLLSATLAAGFLGYVGVLALLGTFRGDDFAPIRTRLPRWLGDGQA